MVRWVPFHYSYSIPNNSTIILVLYGAGHECSEYVEQHGIADADEEPASTHDANADALDGSDVAIEAVLQHIADGGSQDLPAGYSIDDNSSLITHNEVEVYESEVAGHAQVAEALNMGKGGEEKKKRSLVSGEDTNLCDPKFSVIVTSNSFDSLEGGTTRSTILAPVVLAYQPPPQQINKLIHHTLESNTMIDEALHILKRVPLDRSTPAWLMELGQYAQKVRQVPLLGPDFTCFDSNIGRNEVYGEWEEFVHLSRVTYYYNRTRNTYTGLNIRDCSQDHIDKFKAWIEVTQGQMVPFFSENVTLPIDGIINDLNLRPNFDFKLDHILLRQLRNELDWFHAESSTSTTIFSNRETMEEIIS
ncbi:uncharacterized protein F5891DRAFT_982936 [Suillus fuscotomentosus]|uniref:Uncharacterized protein n=1 Tax=Suillus fuscotomentosus TaxID=1912939 RepID=A0AAD4HHY0_9AGAM|nr:uncharacterized protein F5891DRAFT_982936 [Suillus fuscotomentosus]KAG1897147.1 hypothetical protein F5891DRAFT_982936 [Suillus fuscotomentosus]